MVQVQAERSDSKLQGQLSSVSRLAARGQLGLLKIRCRSRVTAIISNESDRAFPVGQSHACTRLEFSLAEAPRFSSLPLQPASAANSFFPRHSDFLLVLAYTLTQTANYQQSPRLVSLADELFPPFHLSILHMNRHDTRQQHNAPFRILANTFTTLQQRPTRAARL